MAARCYDPGVPAENVWAAVLALAGIGAGAGIALMPRSRFGRLALVMVMVVSWTGAAAIVLRDRIAVNPLLYAVGAVLALGMAAAVWLFLRLPDRRFYGNRQAQPETPPVELREPPERSAEEVLKYLPRAHKDLLYSILDRGSRQLPYSPELFVLSQRGLIDEVVRTYQDRGVFRVPEAVRDLVLAHRQEEKLQRTLEALGEAESRPEARDFLSLYTADEMPSSVPLLTYRAAETLGSSSLVTRGYDAEGLRFTYTLTEDARGALEGSLLGHPIKRTRVELAAGMIEGYDPDAPDYSGRALLRRPDEDD
jgi:hypothetical protein